MRGGVESHFCHFLLFSLFKSTLRSNNSCPAIVLACASLCGAHVSKKLSPGGPRQCDTLTHTAWHRPRWDGDVASDTSEGRRWGRMLQPEDFCQRDGFQLVAQPDPKMRCLFLCLWIILPWTEQLGHFVLHSLNTAELSNFLFSTVKHTQQ